MTAAMTRVEPAVRLRLLTVDDVTPTYVAWLQDPEVTRYLMAQRTPQTLESVRAFVAGLQGPHARACAVMLGDRWVGTVCLRQIDWPSLTAEVGILIGDRSVWRQGVARAALQEITAVARRFRLRKLWAGTCNPACAALFRACGWHDEGCQRAHVYLDGAWRDHTLHALVLEDRA